MVLLINPFRLFVHNSKKTLLSIACFCFPVVVVFVVEKAKHMPVIFIKRTNCFFFLPDSWEEVTVFVLHSSLRGQAVSASVLAGTRRTRRVELHKKTNILLRLSMDVPGGQAADMSYRCWPGLAFSLPVERLAHLMLLSVLVFVHSFFVGGLTVFCLSEG